MDQFFNDSTGEGDEGEDGLVDPILEAAGLKKVDSPIFDGEGLEVTPTAPQPDSEVTSPVDSTPVGDKRRPVKSQSAPQKKTGTRSK